MGVRDGNVGGQAEPLGELLGVRVVALGVFGCVVPREPCRRFSPLGKHKNPRVS